MQLLSDELSDELSDDQLLALLKKAESDCVEYKERFTGNAPETIRQAVCAFANDLPGHGAKKDTCSGVVFIGVKDKDGTFTDLRVTDELLRDLSDIRYDGNILPPPVMAVEKRCLQGHDLAVITVMPADAPPVRYKGKIYIRTGPRRGIASTQEERILNERRRYKDLPFDIQPVSFADVQELNRAVFESEYLPNLVSAQTLEENHRSYEERLISCRMAVDEEAVLHPIVLGSMVLGNRPRDFIPSSYAQFLRIDGTELNAPIMDEAAIDGRTGEIIKTLEDKLRAHITTRIELTVADREKRRVNYPLAALQQFVRNAIMHRTYEKTHAPIRIYWFNNRIEILSPGGPYGIVNHKNFGEPGITDYRNPHLAEALKVLGYVQRFGVGIATARRLLAENGNPKPVFSTENDYVLVTLGVAL